MVDQGRADVVACLGEVHLIAHAVDLLEAATDRFLEAVHAGPRIVVVGEPGKLHIATGRLATAFKQRLGRGAEQPAADHIVGADVEGPRVAKGIPVHVAIDRDHLHALGGKVLHLFHDRRILGLDDGDRDAGNVRLAAKLSELFDLALCRAVVLLHHDAEPLRPDVELLPAFDQSGVARIPEGVVAVGDEDQPLGARRATARCSVARGWRRRGRCSAGSIGRLRGAAGDCERKPASHKQEGHPAAAGESRGGMMHEQAPKWRAKDHAAEGPKRIGDSRPAAF